MSAPLRSLVIIACSLWGLAALGFDAYLKIDTVAGEATDSQHLKWIGIQSLAQGATQPGRVSFSDLCLLKPIDSSSPILAQACAKGSHFSYATLDLVTSDANRVRFYELTLSNVVVTGLSTVGNAGGDRPTERLCLGYASIGWTYTEVDARGVAVGELSSWWDIARNTGGTNLASAFTVSATQVDPGTLLLSWPGLSNRTYNILSSPTVTGSYQLLQNIPAPGDGPVRLPVAISGGAKFFRVQQAP